jgi:hypothetical protein
VTDEAHSQSPFLRRIGLRHDPAETTAENADVPEEPETPPESGSAREGLRRALLDVGERVDEIISGAERTAEEIRRRAQIDADRYLAERQRRADALEAERKKLLSEALETLRGGTTRIEEEAERVSRSIEEIIRRGEQTTGSEAVDEPAPEAPRPAPSAPAPVAYPGRPAREREPEGTDVEPRVSMLIRATQLAVQGHDRVEIEQTLESEFGATDAKLVVDQVLGTH